jgi:predicted nucleic acid-binding protein
MIAGCRNLDILQKLYSNIIIPLEVKDEILEGRRFARIEKLTLTGSLGILLKARKNKFLNTPLKEIIPKIIDNGIWLGQQVIQEALEEDELIIET